MKFNDEMIDSMLTIDEFGAKYAEDHGETFVDAATNGPDLVVILRNEDGEEHAEYVYEDEMADILNCDCARLGHEGYASHYVCGFNR